MFGRSPQGACVSVVIFTTARADVAGCFNHGAGFQHSPARNLSAFPQKRTREAPQTDVRFVPKADASRCSKSHYSITSSARASSVERTRRLQVEHEFKVWRLQHRKVCGLGALQSQNALQGIRLGQRLIEDVNHLIDFRECHGERRHEAQCIGTRRIEQQPACERLGLHF
jgi:hypothetical protein